MKAVADHLGVSVPGLYHHVQGREDLMRLGAEYSAAELHVPVDHGQHWSAWLLEWATYSHDAFVAQPALLDQFLNSSLGVDRMVTHVDAVIGVLSRQGFSPAEAVDAYEIVSDCALGCAVGRDPARPRPPAPAGRSGRSTCGSSPRGPTTSCRTCGLWSPPSTGTGADFTQRVLTVLAGIAVRRGEPWEPVLAQASSSLTMLSRPARRRCAGWPARRCRGRTR